MLDILTQGTALAALAVVAVQQILKLNFIPVTLANRYPVPTLIVLSVLASIGTAYAGGVHITTWAGWLLETAVVAVSAAVTYNATLKNWNSLRAAEGPTAAAVVVTEAPQAVVTPAVVETPVVTAPVVTPVVAVPEAGSAEQAIAQSINPPTA